MKSITKARCGNLLALLAVLWGSVFAPPAHARPLRGKYLIPTAEADLAEKNAFPTRLEADEASYENFTAIKFPLPQEITGRLVEVEVALDATTNTWQGPLTQHASCAKAGRYFRCEMKFQDLAIDENEVKQHLSGLSVPDADKDLFARLSKAFSNEPAGVICYRLRGKSGKHGKRGGKDDASAPKDCRTESESP